MSYFVSRGRSFCTFVLELAEGRGGRRQCGAVRIRLAYCTAKHVWPTAAPPTTTVKRARNDLLSCPVARDPALLKGVDCLLSEAKNLEK